MADLVDVLSRSPSANLGRTIVDRTELKGRYDLELQWRSANLAATAAGQDSEPDLMTAVQEQLGLKLVAKRGRLDTIVIDNVEMPTPN